MTANRVCRPIVSLCEASAHVTSFLSICSHHRVSVSHITGSKNIPSDYASHHPMSCPESSCQICKFVSEMEESVVYSLTGHQALQKGCENPGCEVLLQRMTIASEGLLIEVCDAPFHPANERIVVSRSVLHGLITAVHLCFNHPSPYRMKQVMERYFYALDMEGAIKTTCSSCHHCNSVTRLIDNEQHQTFQDAILSLVREIPAAGLLRFRLTMLLV